MIEQALYKCVRDAYFALTKSMYSPLTEDFIVHHVGRYGLEVLVNSKYIGPTTNRGQYVLWCEG